MRSSVCAQLVAGRRPRQPVAVRRPAARPATSGGRTGARRPGRRARRCAAATSTIVSPCQSITQPAGVGDLADARWPRRPTSRRPPGTRRACSGSTTAIMRSCDSLIRISSGASVGVAQRHPVELDVHAAVAVRGELGRRAGQAGARRGPGCRRPGRAANSSRQHSMSTFSANGSPTCTAGRLVGPSRRRRSRRPAPMRRRCRRRRCARRTGRPCCRRPTALASLHVLVPQHADAQRVDQRVAVVASGRRRPRRRCSAGRGSCRSRRCRRRRRAARGAVSGASAAPKRSGSITATGRAPIERMSRTMPPTPVAAPW